MPLGISACIVAISALGAAATACGDTTPPLDLPPPATYSGIFMQGAEQLFFVPCPAISTTVNFASIAFSNEDDVKRIVEARSSILSTRVYIEFTGRRLTATNKQGFGTDHLSFNYSVHQLLRVEPRTTCP